MGALYISVNTLNLNTTSSAGQPFDPSPTLTKAVSNVICALAFGHQFSTEDENMQKLLGTLDLGLTFGGSFFHVVSRLLFGRCVWGHLG